MKLAIVDAAYKAKGTFFRGTAASWLEWECRNLGAELVDPAAADSILITASDPREHVEIARILRRHKVQGKGQRKQHVFVGGGIGSSPAILDPQVDAVCVGEGRNFIKALVANGPNAAMALPNAWVPGETRPVVPDSEFPWDSPPVVTDSGSANIYISRGCQKKCLFCQTGWAGPYVENPLQITTTEQLLRERKIPIVYVSNDVAAVEKHAPLDSRAFSATYDGLMERRYDGKMVPAATRLVRIGVEAGSERMRKLLGKPIPADGLAKATAELMQSGVDVRWFMMAGVPWENEADWQELRDVVYAVKRATRRNLLELSFTAFLPAPAAPLCIAPLEDSYWDRFKAFSDWFFDTKAFSRRIRILKPCKPTSRLEYAKAAMAATEEELRRGFEAHTPANWRIEYPWKRHMRRAYAIFKRRAATNT